jgi:hypothetical protein
MARLLAGRAPQLDIERIKTLFDQLGARALEAAAGLDGRFGRPVGPVIGEVLPRWAVVGNGAFDPQPTLGDTTATTRPT